LNAANPNLALLERIVSALGALSERFVFIGGCATGLLVTDTAAAPVRATRDVDVIVEVLTLADYHGLERELEAAGFARDRDPDAPICRWVIGGALLDVMPTDARVLGFGNRWFAHAAHTAQSVRLPSGKVIRRVTAPLFLATKLEAFRGWGGRDFRASHDLEDIVTVVDGRSELIREVEAEDPSVRNYIASAIGASLRNPAFVEALQGHLPGDGGGQARLPLLLDRLRSVASL
jgi:hypothetical protein